ncbi:hypothetical protein L195_g026914, partial [Trifolium pratense]
MSESNGMFFHMNYVSIDMEEDLGRGRPRRKSNVYCSARRELAANAPVAKRERHKQGPPPYHKQRAIPIWDAHPNDPKVLKKNLRCIANGKKIISVQKPNRDVAWFWVPIEASGLGPLTRTNYSILDHGLLTTFAERWHPETSTFHLPI